MDSNTHKVGAVKVVEGEGSEVKVKCKKGFEPKFPFVATCTRGRWKVPHKCQPVDCGSLIVNHATAGKSNFSIRICKIG